MLWLWGSAKLFFVVANHKALAYQFGIWAGHIYVLNLRYYQSFSYPCCEYTPYRAACFALASREEGEKGSSSYAT